MRPLGAGKTQVEAWLDRRLDRLERFGTAVILGIRDHYSHARRALYVSLFVSLGLLTAIRGVDGVLSEMHKPDSPSRDFGSLAGLRVGLPDPNAAATSVAIWRAWAGDPARAASGFSTPGQVLSSYIWLDTAFIIFYVAVFAILLSAAHTRLDASVATRRAVYQRLAALAVPTLLLFAIADLVENLLSATAYEACADGCGGILVYPLAAAAVAKYVLGLLVVIPLVYAAIAIPTRGPGGDWRAIWRIVRVLRVQVIAVLAFGLALFGPVFAPQGADTIRRWPSPDVSDGVAAAVLTLAFTLLTLVLSWRLLESDATTMGAGRARRRIPLLRLTLIGAALVLVGVVLDDHGIGLASLGVILIVIAALSYPVRKIVAPERTPGRRRATDLPTLIAVAPLVLLALAMIGAATPQLAYTREGRYVFLVAGAGVLMVLAWAVYVLLRDAWSPAEVDEPPGTNWAREGGKGWAAFLWGASLAVAVAYIAISLNPWALGDAIGAIGLLVIWLGAVSLLGYAFQRLDLEWRPPQAFTALGFSRMPIVLVLALWAVVASRMDDGGYHDARPLEQSVDGREERGPTTRAEDAWARWLDAQKERVGAGTTPDAIPLVLVAAEGGGLRAAWWAARVLDCAVDGDAASCGYELEGQRGSPESLFALSGASGGSVGLASYVAAVGAGIADTDWVDDRLALDFVAPLWASLLYVDLPNGFLKLNVLPDRAEVLERSWEQPWAEKATLFDVPESEGPFARGLFETYWGSQTPLLLLSGTSVLDGCRVNNSVLVGAVPPGDTQLAPACTSMTPFDDPPAERPVFTATYDLGRVLCNTDVRLSTAALLSARFPFVTPSGRLQICGSNHAIFVVDGGYYDNSGASALLELWDRVGPLVDAHNARTDREFCVVPTFLHLDNHVRSPPQPTGPRRPPELTVPLTAANKIRDGHDGDVRQAAAAAFQGAFGSVGRADAGGVNVPRYAYIFPRAEPGADAPLGWALSESSASALEHQLAGNNRETLEDVHRWFSSDLSCVDAAASR